MFRYYLVFFCAFLVKGESLSNNRAIKIVDLYNTKLVFFQNSLSSNYIENLQYSTENIDYEKIALLRQALDSYVFLNGEIIKWCSYVNTTARFLNAQTLNQNGLQLEEKTTFFLNEMKKKFIQIRDDHLLNWDPSFEAAIHMTNNNLKLEVLSGNLPKDVNWNNLFADAKIKGHAEIISPAITFYSNITRAIETIEYVLNQISYTTNTYEDLDTKEMLAKCSPIINSLPNANAPHQITLSEGATTTPKMIEKAMQDELTDAGKCGSFRIFFLKKPICKAKLSKNTMIQIEKYYSKTSVMSQFLEDINNSKEQSDCHEHLLDFFKNRYVTWAYEFQNMTSDQYLLISLCTYNDEVSFNIV